MKAGKLGETPEEVAAFLKTASGLDKTMIGDYLGEKEDLSLRVMHAYVDSFNFEEQEFDEAIRSFLMGFRLPGEAQKIDRIMEKFAERYCKCNPNYFTSADTAYVLAYSVIMLNTDAHNPTVKIKVSVQDDSLVFVLAGAHCIASEIFSECRANSLLMVQMSKQEFIRNNRGIDDGNDLPEEFMSGLYDRIVSNEIKMKPDTPLVQEKQSTNLNRILGLDSILNLVMRKPREEKVLETSDDVIKHMQEQFRAKAGKSECVLSNLLFSLHLLHCNFEYVLIVVFIPENRSVYYAASDVDILRPMVEVSWAPMLAAFSVPLDQSDDEIITYQCLEGFRHAVHITAVMCMKTQRDAFLTSLAKFTSLHSAADIKQKNIDAIKVRSACTC